MNLHSVAEEISARLATIPGLLQTNIGGPASITTPCSVIALPEGVDYLGAFGRQMARVSDWSLLLLAGTADKVENFERIAEYAAGSGESSVKEILESSDPLQFDPYTACHNVVVKSVSFEIVTWQEQDFQGALFMLDVFGSGQETP